MNPARLDSLASNQQIPESWIQDEHGIAVLISLIALSTFSLLALYMCLNATVETRISDNYESSVKADFAALAGINMHGRCSGGLTSTICSKVPMGHTSIPRIPFAVQNLRIPQPLALVSGARNGHPGSRHSHQCLPR